MTNEQAAGVVFVLYMLGVFGLAILSNRLLSGRGFLAEYFLGSRGLGVWALAFTFAATSASGGSFTGFPSLIYTHGWILGFWIAGYMVMPLVTMGLMGKRLNQVARRAGAITIPDVLRERYQANALGLVASMILILFTITNLIAQFKAGGLILSVLLDEFREISELAEFLFGSFVEVLPAGVKPIYVLSLFVFAFTVILYTAYGGFRAVVWTDVLQGVVMGFGVVLLIPFVISKAGGLENVSRTLNERPPSQVIGLISEDNALEFFANEPSRDDLFLQIAIEPETRAVADDERPQVAVEEFDDRTLIRVGLTRDPVQPDRVATTSREVLEALRRSEQASALIQVRLVNLGDDRVVTGEGTVPINEDPINLIPGSQWVYGPGRKSDGAPFLPLALSISFFFFWPIAAAGQPGSMVRMMAFRDTKTLRVSIWVVTLYYSAIYLPMVFLFVTARTLIHPAELASGSDQIMPQLAKIAAPWWLAGILIAAPFAAVMSTVDSFLLMISSSFVRDIYQSWVNPDVAEKRIKQISYATTAIVGVLVTTLALNPPEFLQTIIVFTGAAFASTFLAPIFLGVYWKRMTRLGAWASLLSGFGIIVVAHTIGPYLFDWPVNPLGFEPVLLALLVSFALGIGVSLVTPKFPDALIRRYFSRVARPDEAS